MAFLDVIDDYSDGATGSLTTVSGGSVGYTIDSTADTVNWNTLDGGAKVNGNGTQAFTTTFDTEVIGAMIQISGSNSNEPYYVEVDGVTVDLNVLIASGDVTFSQSGASTHVIRADGGINGGHHSDGSIGELTFNFPVTSLGVYGSGANSGNWDYVEVGIDASLFEIACFTRGTLIETVTGPCAVEDLLVGQLIETQNDGLKPVVWIGSKVISRAVLDLKPDLHPIRITAGALGCGLPHRDLLVSKQHRMLVSSKIASRMFGVTDVLVAAHRLTALPGIYVDMDVQGVEYFHVMFDSHQVVLAEGAPSESLFFGAENFDDLPGVTRQEVLAIFPELSGKTQTVARQNPKGNLQRRLIERHAKNQKPLLGAATL